MPPAVILPTPSLQGAYLNRCQLRGAYLLNANLQQVKAQEASMDGVQADYADFSFANLPYSWLRRASLKTQFFMALICTVPIWSAAT